MTAFKSAVILLIAAAQTHVSSAADIVALHPASVPAGVSMASFYGATWTGNQFVVVGESGAILTSPDGSTWTDRSVPLVFPLFAVAGDTTMIVAVGYGSEVWSSPDGSTWTRRVPETMVNLYGVAVGIGPDDVSEFVAAGAGGAVICTTSPMGVTSRDANVWYKESSSTAQDLNAVFYGSGHFKAVGHHFSDLSGNHATIVDGGAYAASWSDVASSASEDLFGLTAFNSFFLSVGDTGTAMFTPFTSTVDVGVTTPLRASAFGSLPTDIATVGDDGVVVASFDEGGSWKRQDVPTSQNLHAIAISSSKQRIVIAGEDGTLLYGDIVRDDIFNNGFDF
jgi:photosystem II stability/assembly factor-like uncharacterized protein